MVGKFSLTDVIHVRRTWKLGPANPQWGVEEEQMDADSYYVTCSECGQPLDLQDMEGLEEIHAPEDILAEEKDSW